MTYLGIDLGTSGLRALLIDHDGKSLCSAEANYKVSHPHPGWSEQDPEDWVLALEKAVAQLRMISPEFTELRAIAVAGHMHGATLLDKDNAVLRPCILWNDSRSKAEARRLDEIASFRSISGNIVFPGFTAPKLEWLRENESEIHKRIAKVLLPTSYLNFYLTGEYVCDMSDAAGTSWLDISKRSWSDYLLAATNMHEGQMPKLIEGCQKAGVLRDDVKKRWGIENEVIVAGGAGDNAAAACGIGALSEGQGFVSLGTSGVVLVARDKCIPAPETAVHTFCHALPNRWYQMGVMLSATDCLNWLADITNTKPAELTQTLSDKLRGPSKIQFMPYLSGERTPYNDADVRGAFFSLSKSSTNTSLTHAVLTGVAFGLRDCLEALKSVDVKTDSLFAIGGGAKSDYWVELAATILKIPLKIPSSSEFGAALGAARLAVIADNEGAIDSLLSTPAVKKTIEPKKDFVKAYDDAYRVFKSNYKKLKSIET